MDEFEELIRQIRQLPETDLYIDGPQLEESIKAVEDALGVSMPPSYRNFLKTFGEALWSGVPVGGIYHNQPFSDGMGNVYYDTMRARTEIQIPMTYIVLEFGEDPDEIVCLDAGHPNNNGEYPVIRYDSQYNDIYPIADTFADYFRSFLQMVLTAG